MESAAVRIMESAAKALHTGYDSYSNRTNHHYYTRQNEAHIHIDENGNGGTIGFIFDTLIPFIQKTIYVAICSIFCFCSSCIMYAILYWLIMPSNYAKQPVFFDYYYQGKCSSHHRTIQRQQYPQFEHSEIKEELQCPPTAVINMHQKHTQWYAHVNDVTPSSFSSISSDKTVEESQSTTHTQTSPSSSYISSYSSYLSKILKKSKHLPYSYSHSSKRLLSPHRPYFIQIALTLPESYINQHLGIFMIDVDLKDSQGQYLASSTRSAMFPYTSSYVLMVKKSVLMGPLLIGALKETRTVVVECFDHYIESLDKPLETVEIRLILPNKAIGESIQVLDAELRIGKELNYIQKLLKEWFYTFAFVTIFFLMIGHGILVYCLKVLYNDYVASRQGRSTTSTSEEFQYYYEGSQDGGGNGSSADGRNTGEDYSILESDNTPNSSRHGKETRGHRRGDLNANRQYYQFDDDDDLSGEWESTTTSIPDLDNDHTSDKNQLHPSEESKDNDIIGDTSSVQDALPKSSTHEQQYKTNTRNDTKSPIKSTFLDRRKCESKTNPTMNQSEEKSSSCQKSMNQKSTGLSSKNEEMIMAEKVMKGDIEPYEIFTGKKNSNSITETTQDSNDDDIVKELNATTDQ